MAKKKQFPDDFIKKAQVNSADKILLADAITGDPSFTLVNDVVGGKVDKEIGKGLSSNDFTSLEKSKIEKIKIDGAVDKYLNEQGEYKKIIIPDANMVTITTQESVIGTYTIDGNYLPIYSTSYKLLDLPTNKEEIKEYSISNEPLGYGMYMNVDKSTISTGRSLYGEFFNENYKVDKIYIDEEFKTKVVIKCIDVPNTSNVINMLLTLEYLKYDGNVVEFTVNVPSGVNPDDVTLEFPKLKFNKKFAFSYITDDSNSIYQFYFSGINKRWVATTMQFYLHLNFPISPDFTEGFMPEYPLEFTDGGGNKRRFATSIAVWPDKLFDPYASGNNVGKNYPWMSSKEWALYKDFGYSVLYHDFNGYDGSSVTQENFNQWFADTKAKFLEYINDSPKIIAEPNGDHRYLALSQNIPDIVMNTAQSGDPLIKKAYPYRTGYSLDKSQIAVERLFSGASDYADQVFNILKSFNDTSNLENIYWLIGASHRTNVGDYEMFKRINDSFGARGNDKVWFASVDEVYEYWFLTKNATVVKSFDNQSVTFKIYIPSMPRFWFNEVSCLLSGINSTSDVTISSNTDGLSYGVSDSKLLVNLNFNSNLRDKAEKYVSQFESTPNAEYIYDDAMYMVSQLKLSLREPYINRLNVFTSPPVLSSVLVNNGAQNTENGNVTITLAYTGTQPTHYMISESPTFVGGVWVEYKESSPYSLSNGYGIKTIFTKLKNTYGDSNVISQQINYKKPSLMLTSIAVPTSTNNRNISIPVVYQGTPTDYRIGEQIDLNLAVWVPFANPIPYQVSEGYGNKSVYIQLRDSIESQLSEVKNGVCELVNPQEAKLNYISIDNGDESTTSNIVSVTYNTTNSITHYRIAETTSELATAPWAEYNSDTVTFISATNDGILTIYGQVKNTYNESDVKSDSIIVSQPLVVTGMTIENGDNTFAGYSPNVVFSINSGVPTHYRLAETSAGITGTAWLPWSENITFTFASIGAKTLYGQVKNAVSESSIVNDSITLMEPPVAVLIGFNAATNNANTKVVTAGLTTNQIKYATYSGYGALQLVDTTGANVTGMFFNLNSSFYVANDIFNAGNTYENTNLDATVASGSYNLQTMAKVMTTVSSTAADVKRKARFSLTVPTGTYRFRFLWNTSNSGASANTESRRLNSFYGLFQGATELGRVVCTPNSSVTGLNNSNFNAEIQVTVTDGSIPVDLGVWSSVGGQLPGINLIEISKLS